MRPNRTPDITYESNLHPNRLTRNETMDGSREYARVIFDHERRPYWYRNGEWRELTGEPEEEGNWDSTSNQAPPGRRLAT
jgi:hypothetical protein